MARKGWTTLSGTHILSKRHGKAQRHNQIKAKDACAPLRHAIIALDATTLAVLRLDLGLGLVLSRSWLHGGTRSPGWPRKGWTTLFFSKQAQCMGKRNPITAKDACVPLSKACYHCFGCHHTLTVLRLELALGLVLSGSWLHGGTRSPGWPRKGWTTSSDPHFSMCLDGMPFLTEPAAVGTELASCCMSWLAKAGPRRLELILALSSKSLKKKTCIEFMAQKPTMMYPPTFKTTSEPRTPATLNQSPLQCRSTSSSLNTAQLQQKHSPKS